MLSDDDVTAIHSRLLVLESLIAMQVAAGYVERAKLDPNFDAKAAVRRDVRRWVARIRDIPGADRNSIEMETLRILGRIESSVGLATAA